MKRKNQYIIVISGKIEEIEKKGDNCAGNLEYTDFDFQINIKKFIIDEATKKEIELEILNHEEKNIEYEGNNQGLLNYI